MHVPQKMLVCFIAPILFIDLILTREVQLSENMLLTITKFGCAIYEYHCLYSVINNDLTLNRHSKLTVTLI